MESTDSLDENALRKYLADQNGDVQQVYSWITNSNYKEYANRIFGDEN